MSDQDVMEMFTDPVYAKDYTGPDDEYMSYLAVLPRADKPLSEKEWHCVIMGDLRPAFGGLEWYDPEQPDVPWGNYYPEAIIKEALKQNGIDPERITYGSEGATFFAYAKDEESARGFLEFVGQYLEVHRGE
jgi:hypothetical protein